nr:ABC transporter substrate-binding protein [Devosia lucknowensis]
MFFLTAAGGATAAGVKFYPALDGNADARVLLIYSSLDLPTADPMLSSFQRRFPGIAVQYEEFLTSEIHDRVVRETDAGEVTADVVFSSAMDLQIKLANDGYAQQSNLPLSDSWPRWANWRNTAYALTYEPVVFVYHKPSFANMAPPSTRGELEQWLIRNKDTIQGKVGTYDIETAGLGFLFFSRDQEQYRDIWELMAAMGAAGARLHSTTSEILDRVADGRYIFGYNLVGTYAAEWAVREPNIGVVLPEDYTIIMSRIGLVPKASAAPDLGGLFLDYFMSQEGQTVMARELHIAALNPSVEDGNTADAMRTALSGQLRPVPVSPGLLVYLDQVKRARLIDRWRSAFDVSVLRNETPVEADDLYVDGDLWPQSWQ